MLESVEQRKTYLKNKIRDDKAAAGVVDAIVKVVRAWDGKVLNRNFADALRKETGIIITTEFSYNSDCYYIMLHSSFDNHCHYYTVKTGRGFTKTDSGKYRINALGFVADLKECAKQKVEAAQELERSEDIETIRAELAAFANAFRAFKEKYNDTVLTIAGCNYSLKPCDSGQFSDFDYAVY
jgi:hypothetical protein